MRASRLQAPSTSGAAVISVVASASSRRCPRASSASASAARRSCSTITRSVTSFCTPTKLTSSPSPSNTGEIDTWFQKAVPSRR